MYGFPISHSYMIRSRIIDHFDFFYLIKNIVFDVCFYIFHLLITTMQLIESSLYMRKGNQPSPAPHKSKEVFTLSAVYCAVTWAMTMTHKSGVFARKGQRQLGKKNGLTGFRKRLTAHVSGAHEER